MAFTEMDMERIGRILSDKYGITVKCRGSQAYTDGKTVVLPSLPDKITDPKIVSTIRYFLDHEVGHIVGESDYQLFVDAKSRSSAEYAILNALEDRRCESLMGRIWAGAGLNMTEGAEHVLNHVQALADAGDVNTQHPLKQLTTAIYCYQRGRNLKPKFIEPRIWSIMDKYRAELDAICKAGKTADCLPLTQTMLKEYKILRAEEQVSDASQDAASALSQQAADASEGEQQEQGNGTDASADRTPASTEPTDPKAGRDKAPDRKAKAEAGSDGSDSTEAVDDGGTDDDEAHDEQEAEDDEQGGDAGEDGAEDDSEGEEGVEDDDASGDTEPDTDAEGEAGGDGDDGSGSEEDDAVDQDADASGEQGDDASDMGDEGDEEVGEDDGQDAGDSDSAGGGDESDASEDAGGGDGGTEASDDDGDGDGDGGGGRDAGEGGEADAEEAGEGGDGTDQGGSNGAGQADHGSGGDTGGVGGSGRTFTDEELAAVDLDELEVGDASKDAASVLSQDMKNVAVADPFKSIRLFDKDQDRIVPVPSPRDKGEGWYLAQAIEKAGGAMRQRLIQLLMSEDKVDWQRGRKSGSCDPRALYKLVTKTSDRVMRRSKTTEAPDTACMLLLDMSGSMHGGRIEYATQAAAVFAQTMEVAGHATSIIGFDDACGGSSWADRESIEAAGAMRRSGITLYVAKSFEQRFKESLPRIARMTSIAGGGTPMAEAMTTAGRLLAKRPEKRKVLMVFGDGQPGMYVSFAQDVLNQAHAKGIDLSAKGYVTHTCHELERAGMEVVIIGIQTTALEHLWHKTAYVANLTDLSKTTIKQLTKALKH